MLRTVPILLGVLLGTAIGAEPPPRFAKKPRSTRAGRKVRIEFTADRETDVAVAIIDAKGKVVRHLAAGVLCVKAPAPLKPGLSQTLEWDGKDDLGRPALSSSKGPFKARVSLGLRPAFDGFIGFDPASYNPLRAEPTPPRYPVRALATGPKGELFVFYACAAMDSWSVATSCAVFSRDGKYLRTIVPYPASLGEEKLKGLKRLELEDGLKVPFVHHKDKFHGGGTVGRGRSLLPLNGEAKEGNNRTGLHRAVATRDGRVAFLAAPFAPPHREPRGVFVIGADGGAPVGGVIRTIFPKGVLSADLALSPDEKTLYASVAGTKAPKDLIYKFGWKDEKPSEFTAKGLSNPRGLAVDKDGNVYVADRGNDRVAIFKADGLLLGELKVIKPERVEVHPRSGALYVLAGEKADQLLKYKSWKAAGPAAKLVLPTSRRRDHTAVMALDASAEPPVLWLSPSYPSAKFRLSRVEDRGSSFGDRAEIGSRQATSPLNTNDVLTLSVSRDAGVLNIGSCFYDLKKGRFLNPAGTSARLVGTSTGAFGLDGNFYIQRAHTCFRLGPDLKLLPFPKGGSDAAAIAEQNGNPGIKGYKRYDKYGGLQGIGGSARLRGRGVTADSAGNVYVLLEKAWKSANETALSLYNPDGSMKNKLLIDTEFRCMESVRVDFQGNVYVAVSIRPGKQLLPPGLVGKVPADKDSLQAKRGVDYFPGLYGSIIKFGPEGGVIKKGCGGTKCNYAYGGTTEVKGAKWVHLGVTGTMGFSTTNRPTHHCSCQSSRIDVDGFGRVFFPDAARFRVWVLDTGGNKIGWFGSYGNVDSGGPKSTITKPEIPLAWPQAVAVDSGKNAYVGDRINRRVVKVKLEYAAEETCALP